MEVKNNRLPSLDGWRALSIIMVVAAHTKHTFDFPEKLDVYFKWLFDGDLGVRTFFIISGLLITWLLLNEEKAKGSISLKKFYIRRVLRIWPVYYAFLFVLLLLQLFASYHQDLSVWIGNMVFMTNYFGAKWTSGHLWSLAVEEQFYFIWPLLLVFVKKKRKLLVLLFVPLCIAPVSRVITYLQPSAFPWKTIFCGYSFFNYWDSIAVGCLAALILFHKKTIIEKYLKTLVLISPFLIFVPYILSKLFLLGHFTVSVGPLLQAVGICSLILHSLTNTKLVIYKALNYPVCVGIGTLSYSIYIWQMIFCTKPTDLGFNGSFLFSWKTWFIPVLLFAIISYNFFEKPFLRLRKKFQS